jgi:murein L,D-transpeptidase YcbB/YkuD
LLDVVRLAACGAWVLCLGAQAGAQEARQVWQGEWQGGQPRQMSSWDHQSWNQQSWNHPSWDYRSWGRPSGNAAPPARSRDVQRQRMPTVRVNNPDFLAYTPDKLGPVALGAVCERKNAAATAGAQDSAAPDAPSMTAPPDAGPEAEFVQACAGAPAISLRLLPQVGDAVVRHYTAHPRFLWTDQGQVSAKARAALDTLARSDTVGLDPKDYALALPEPNGNDSQALLRFELTLSARLLTYVLDASRGRIDPNRLSGYHDLPRKRVDLTDALSVMAQSPDIAAWLMQRHPDNAQFRALEAELARERDGAPDRAAKLRMAMEQLRWLPGNLGSRYVFLNQPAFEVTYVKDGTEQLTMRAVIGRPDSQTYVFIDRVKEVTYNPYWNVPRSIVINEMLPRLWRNPSYLDRLGYEVRTVRGRQVASNAVDWAGVATDQAGVDVRQPPGPRNALGRLKIDFPNKHAIYLHDTPQKHLFAREERAFSHGCVRLQHPREMAAALLGTSVAEVDRKIARGETMTDRVPGEIAIYLAYFTAWPDAQGTVRYYKDVYRRDAHLAQAIAKTAAARSQQ